MTMGDQLKLQSVQRGATVVALSMSLLGMGASAHAAPGTKGSDFANTGERGSVAKRLINVRSIGTKCGKEPIAMASGRGKMTLRIDETRSKGTVLSKNIEASKGVISAGVGWDVTKSRSITVSGSKEVPRGKHGTLTAYVKYSGKKFDVQAWLIPEDVKWVAQKNKTAYKPIGVCFKYSER
ncbi:hypothetical protein ACWGKK_05280 [Streptomyces chartreusis]|uniref:hypothetical protein n=2 Tax=Streptomyces TaxID=1883 RepID=UPI0033EADBD0